VAVRSRCPIAAAAVLALGLTGCGGADPSAAELASAATSPSPSVSASADGSRLAGAGYSFALPPRWRDATDEFQQYSELIDVGAVNAEQAGQPFNDNVNVLRNADQAQLPPAQAEEQFTGDLATVASRVEVRPPVTIGGVDALHLTGRTDAGEVTAVTDQYVAYVAGAYYVVTFSFDRGTPRPQREDEISSVLDSWTWD
jgi:hypothetical protein